MKIQYRVSALLSLAPFSGIASGCQSRVLVVEPPSRVQTGAQNQAAAKIEFYDCKNVVSKSSMHRAYRPAGNGSTTLTFQRLRDAKTVAPGTPEYAKMIRGWTLIAGPADVLHASMQPNRMGGYSIVVDFTPVAAQKWRDWSRANNHSEENIAAVLNGRAISIAAIKDGAVLAGGMQVMGNFTKDYLDNRGMEGSRP